MKLFKSKETGALLELVLDGKENVSLDGFIELKAGAVDAATEKHVPVVSQDGKKHVPVVSQDGNHLNVKVGEVAHPMTEEHWITSIWVEFEDGTVQRKSLLPTDAPETHFCLGGKKGKVTVYEYCNLHGLWKAELIVE